MTADRTRAIHLTERVAAWPRISATVHPDGTGTLTINGTERPCAAPSVEELRTGMIARCARLAGRLRRPVRLSVNDGAATWTLAVRSDGVVQLVDVAGTIPAPHGLAAHEGRCRACRRLQPVTAQQCAQCNITEPHRVEADPVDARALVPDVGDVVDSLHGSPRNPQVARAPAALHLTFSTQPSIETTENVALGRNPEPIGGRRTIQVASPERLLSRTHLLIDLDDAGRIVVTDHHSGNGTEAQTRPPTRLTPGRPYVVRDGTTLLLGDVAVVVRVA